jgi:membrane protein
MKQRIKLAGGLLKDTYLEWRADRAHRLAAALAFYTAFSLAPLLIIGIAIAGSVLGPQAARGEIVEQVRALIGPQGARAVEAILASAHRPGTGLWASMAGVVALFFAALGVFNMLQDAMNMLWNVGSRRGSWWKLLLKDRAVSFIMVLGTGFLLLVSLLMSAFLSGLSHFAEGYLPSWFHLLEWANFVVDFGVVTVLFALIFRYIPDTEVEWRDVWWGAGLTAVLFAVGKFLIGLYLGNSTVASSYGAAGSLVVILVWVYYSAQILFFGAEFTQVYAYRCGSRESPPPRIAGR